MGKFKHGMSKTPIHNKWWSMMSRCYNPNVHNYHRYGGRGIKVCDHWHDFENFYTDMGDCPNGQMIDRIDNNGHYSPENCRWVSNKVQANNRQSNLSFTHQGETKTLMQWLSYFNKINPIKLKYPTVLARITRNWEFLRAVTEPLMEASNRKTTRRTRFITYQGKTQSLKHWVDEFNANRSEPISYNVVKGRLNKGWEFIDALTRPKKEKS